MPHPLGASPFHGRPSPGPQSTSPREPFAVRAMYANQTRWLIRLAVGAGSPSATGRAWEDGGLVAARTGSTGVLVTPLGGDPTPGQIDAGLAWLALNGGGDVLIWSAVPNPSLDLVFASRGCQESFVPCWMWRTLPMDALPRPVPRDIAISIATEGDRAELAGVRDVPYATPDLSLPILSLATREETPRSVWLVIARQRQRPPNRPAPIVGVGTLHLLDVEGKTIAGLYNLGVRPDQQGRGIGTALTAALCRIATAHGAAGIALNATPAGEPVYRGAGFVETGRGQTWFLPQERLRSRPDPDTVRGAEVLGSGMTSDLPASLAGTDRMPNGDTPLAFAARFRQRRSAVWLMANGARPEIPALWRVGLRAEALAAMQDPRYLNAQDGPEGTTPLHEAIRDDDVELARLLVGAGADLSIQDRQYRSTPLGWARALHRPHLSTLIEAASPDPEG